MSSMGEISEAEIVSGIRLIMINDNSAVNKFFRILSPPKHKTTLNNTNNVTYKMSKMQNCY